MAILTIRQLDEKTKARLRVRAARNGRSMEQEARAILRAALDVSAKGRGSLAEAVRRRFAPFGGVELNVSGRDAVREVPEFSE